MKGALLLDRIRVAFIGLGVRGNTYAGFMTHFPDQVQLVACADTDPLKRLLFSDHFGIPAENCFGSDEEILSHDKLADVMVVATQDRQHADMTIAAMRKGYDVLCENPVSPDLESCRQVERVAHETGRKVIVCHVLRYAPFFLTIRKLIEMGKIGEVINIDVTEKVTWWHQAHAFVRGNWRSAETTSPMILQKSGHDMDMLLWLTGKHCTAVHSIGSLKFFKKENAPQGAPKRCSEKCPHYQTCPYSIEQCYLKKAREEGFFGWPTCAVTPMRTLEDLKHQLETGPYGRCVFFCDNDVVDHQHVNLQLEDDVTASFTLSAFTSVQGRRIHVMGTMGDIVGETSDSIIRLTRFGEEPVTIDARHNPFIRFGYQGSEMAMIRDVISVLSDRDRSHNSVTNIQNSVESHVVSLAAEESRLRGGELVRINEFSDKLLNSVLSEALVNSAYSFDKDSLIHMLSWIREDMPWMMLMYQCETKEKTEWMSAIDTITCYRHAHFKAGSSILCDVLWFSGTEEAKRISDDISRIQAAAGGLLFQSGLIYDIGSMGSAYLSLHDKINNRLRQYDIPLSVQLEMIEQLKSGNENTAKSVALREGLDSKPESARKLLEHVMEDMGMPQLPEEEMCHLPVLTLIEQICHYVNDRDPAKTVNVAERMRQIVDYEYQNPGLNRKSIADRFHISESQVSRIFSQEYGILFFDYLQEKRLALACKLMNSTEMSLPQIAENVGYDHYTSFKRAFVRAYGKTPKQLRESESETE